MEKMSNKKYIVYKHTCPNDKTYIGITSIKINDRWRKGKGYISNPYFYKAIQKYGWGNIKHEILFTNLSKNEAEQKEIELIKYYNSNDSKFGYNISNGGNSNGKVSEETKKKISNANKGMTPWNKGKKMSYEFCLKMQEIKKGKGLNQKLLDAIRKPVICIETNIRYESILEASKNTNINFSNIAQVCKNKRNSAGGYHWKYIKGDDYY